MPNQILLYLAAAFTGLWGVAHLFPTKNVVKGFGEISADNRNIITMEWIVEGVALIFIGVLTAVVTAIDPFSPVAKGVYYTTVFALVALALVSLRTGFRVNFVPFKLCPVIFTVAALLIAVGACARF
jgi:hypothetical protein